MCDKYYVNEYYNSLIYEDLQNCGIEIDTLFLANNYRESRIKIIDKMIMIHEFFNLIRETLFISIDIMNRYMSIVKVKNEDIMLIGITSLLIASKYEEIYLLEVKDFLEIFDDEYEENDLIEMENNILVCLDFDLNFTNSLLLMRNYFDRNNKYMSNRFVCFCKYILECSLLSTYLLKYSKDQIVKSTMFIVFDCLKLSDVLEKEDLPEIDESYVEECSNYLKKTIKRIKKLGLNNVREKFNCKVYYYATRVIDDYLDTF